MNITARIDRIRVAVVAAIAAALLLAGGVALSAQADSTQSTVPPGYTQGGSPMKFQ